MPPINTVLGPIAADQLGFTLCHEHIWVSSAGIQHTFPDFADREGALRIAVEHLRAARAGGIQTIIDVTTHDLGRDITFYCEAAEQSGMQIVACTGIWLDIPRVFASATPDQIARLYIREIEVGIEGTGIKAGVIKVATDGDVSPANETVLRAAARAQKATGVPVTTHTNSVQQNGGQQVRIFQDEGVDMSRVCIGHSNDTLDTAYLEGLLASGAYLGMDHYTLEPRPNRPTWQQKTDVLRDMIQKGYANRLMLSHDWVPITAVGAPRPVPPQSPPSDGYLMISRHVLPYLRQLGVAESEIATIMVDNPRRFFGRV